MHCSVCSAKYAVLSVQCGTSIGPCAKCSVQVEVKVEVFSLRVYLSVCSVQCLVFSVQCAVCRVQCLVFSVLQCAVFSVHCAVCEVQYTVHNV